MVCGSTSGNRIRHVQPLMRFVLAVAECNLERASILPFGHALCRALQERLRKLNQTTSILIVILNYRTPALTLECAESLHSTLVRFPDARLVIVDNGSEDDSIHQFRASETLKNLRGRVELLCLANNGGYAVGNNAAIRPALASPSPPDFVWLLNSDTLTRDGALDELLRAMDDHPRMGIAGSRLENADGTPQAFAFRFPNIIGEWEASAKWGVMTHWCERWKIWLPTPITAMRTDWVPGASMFLRRSVLEQIGLLDEAFFMYFEDVDFCRRARDAGWETWCVPDSRVEHRCGSRAGISATTSRQWCDARRHYYRKHHTRVYTLSADGARRLGFGMWRIRHLTAQYS
jgi:N-acetylglucosaminyl-diphospho-decaprenol L-rhamnosyltransferase